MLNKAIVQDSDQTAQTFSGSKVYAVRTVIIKQTTHACHNQTGQSFSGINFTSEHAGANFLVCYIGRTPAREWSVVKVYKLPSWTT